MLMDFDVGWVTSAKAVAPMVFFTISLRAVAAWTVRVLILNSSFKCSNCMFQREKFVQNGKLGVNF
jgi:hypothetical protein